MFRQILARYSVIVALLCGGSLVLGLLLATRDPELERDNQRRREELVEIEAQNKALAVENQILEAENLRLREVNGESVYCARTRLGMIRTGETVYQFVEAGE